MRTPYNGLSMGICSRAVSRAPASGNECHHHFGRLAVDVLPTTVIDGRGLGINVAGRDLRIAQRRESIEAVR
jgi:hypothetical protein